MTGDPRWLAGLQALLEEVYPERYALRMVERKFLWVRWARMETMDEWADRCMVSLVDLISAGVWGLLAAYPYAEPHESTVEALTMAVLLMTDVSNSRPETYKDEPWLKQGDRVQLEHAVEHLVRTQKALNGELGFYTDLGQPELGHAMTRCAFAWWQYTRGGTEEASPPSMPRSRQ